MPFFNKANNLIAEFQGEPVPVYAGVGDSEPMGYLDDYGNLHYTEEYKEKVRTDTKRRETYRGYVITYFNSEEIRQAKLRIDDRLTRNIPIVEYFTVEAQEEFDKANSDGEQLLEDDVDLLKSHPNYVKPPEVSKSTFIIGADPIKSLPNEVFQRVKDRDLEKEMKEYAEQVDSTAKLHDKIKKDR